MSNETHLKVSHSPNLANISQTLMAVGAIVLLIGVLVSPERAWANLLIVSLFVLGIGAGSTFLLASLQLCGARWSKGIYHIPASLWKCIPIGGLGVLLVLLLRPSLYPWYHPSPEIESLLVGFKGWWLNRPAVLARTIIFLCIWTSLAYQLVQSCRKPHATDPASTAAATTRRWSSAFIVIFMITLIFASADWIMSFDPEWFSTMFAVYIFSGFFVSAIAITILIAIWLHHQDAMPGVLTENVIHDLGKLLFAFSIFWMYIWFSQYMLIWYTNIGEETGYFVKRMEGSFGTLMMASLLLNWVVPFLCLLSANAKKNVKFLGKIAALVLVGHWIDLYLMVVPAAVPNASVAVDHAATTATEAVIDSGVPVTAPIDLGIWEFGLVAFGLGLMLIIVRRQFSHRSPTTNAPVLQNA